MTDFESDLATTCVKCGAECGYPARADVVRALELRGDGSFYVDVKTRCAQCSGSRVCVRVNVAMG